VRELDFSKITLRLQEKHDRKGGGAGGYTVGKLIGNTIDILRQGLVSIYYFSYYFISKVGETAVL